MKSKYIEDVFTDYLATKETNYAILINGSWGSGKTFFWKTKLSKFSKDANLKPIYLSLNGLNKIETLDYQLKIKLIPFLDSVDVKKTGALVKISKNIINKLAEKYANFNPEDVLKDVEIDLASFSKSIICFDDLERCKIPLSEVLGYINNYVEHKNLKVIILSNEKEISKVKLDDEGYHAIKEKVIGRILNYKNNLSDILPILFSQYFNDNVFSLFLEEKKDFLFKLLKEYKVENLRNLSFYLDNLKKIYPIIITHKDYIDEVLFFTLLISLEFKDGFLESNDYENYKQLDEINPIDAFFDFDLNYPTSEAEVKEEKPLSYSEIFYAKYLNNNVQLYNFYKSIYTFVLSGFLNEDELKQELQSRYPIIISTETKAFQSIATNNYQTLSDEDFKTLSAEVLQFSEQGIYRIYDYIPISNFFNYYIKNSLIDLQVDDLRKILIAGINIAKQQKEINKRLYDTMFHFNDDCKDEVIVKAVANAHNEILIQLEKVKTNQLLEFIDTNNVEKIEELFDNYVFDTKLFELIAPESLFKSLVNSENKTIFNFSIIIVNRYGASNIGELLHQDGALLTQVNILINEYLEENPVSLKTHLLKELFNKIDNILKKIKR